MYYVYILQSKPSTDSVRGKWKLLYYEAYESESLARMREKRLKHNGNAIRELKKRIGILK